MNTKEKLNEKGERPKIIKQLEREGSRRALHGYDAGYSVACAGPC